jgi:hypothetical protein
LMAMEWKRDSMAKNPVTPGTLARRDGYIVRSNQQVNLVRRYTAILKSNGSSRFCVGES